jgi:two-component system phosphate regulon sensor histidine kinase PhoR
LHALFELVIRDSGIGIARKDLFRIFEPFYRSDPSRVRMQQAAGSGLGLTIVSELLKMHQNKITVRSAVGRGTTVSVLLPGVREPAAVGGAELLREGLNEIAVDFSEKQN